jgi:hypothetical protein
MHIRVFHNTDPAAILSGYKPGQAVIQVYTYDDTESASHDDAREAAFELFNIGHELVPPHRDALAYRAAGYRSLSVGDVVACDSDFYACISLGWQPIPRPCRVIVLPLGTAITQLRPLVRRLITGNNHGGGIWPWSIDRDAHASRSDLNVGQPFRIHDNGEPCDAGPAGGGGSAGPVTGKPREDQKERGPASALARLEWKDAANGFDNAFYDLDSVVRSLDELIGFPNEDSAELYELRGALMAGIRLLRHVADRIEEKAEF